MILQHLKFEIKEDAVISAAYIDSIKFLQAIKDSGYDLSKAKHYDKTPAFIAAEWRLSCLRLLKDLRCDLGQTFIDGCAPAYAAASNGHESCFAFVDECWL